MINALLENGLNSFDNTIHRNRLRGYLVACAYPIKPLYDDHIACLEATLYHYQVVGTALEGYHHLLDSIVFHLVGK